MASTSRLPSRKSRPLSTIQAPASIPQLSIANGDSPPSKQSKRRSLLPQFSRKFSSESETIKEDAAHSDTASVDSFSADPVKVPITNGHSAGLSRRLDRMGGGIPEHAEDDGRDRRRAQDMDRTIMPPPASKLGRPTSVYGNGLGRAPSIRSNTRPERGDARADALAALNGTAPTPSSGASTRLPVSPGKIPTRTTSIRAREPTTRPVASTAAEKRSSVHKSRPASIDAKAAGRPASVVGPLTPTSPTMPRSKPRPQSQMLPPSRPTFNTFQQHYSPAKSALPKPPIPNARHSKALPPTPDAEEVAPSFEVLKQQTELLQLSLLHQASIQTAQEYDASARRKLGKKQAQLRKEHDAIHARESEQRRVTNLTAIEAWCPESSLLAENLQTLSRVHHELLTMTESEGRYAQLVSRFEDWISMSTKDVFIEPLPQDWHKAHTSLALRLRALQRDLSLLPPTSPQTEEEAPSSLHTLLEHSNSLLDGMLKELEMMSKLEKEIVQSERLRVEDEVKALVTKQPAGEQWVPAWQCTA